MGGYDGSITIKTELDTKSFDAQIGNLERDLAEYETQYEAYINAGRKLTEQEAEDFEKLKVKIEQTKNKIIDLNKKQMDLNSTNDKSGFSIGSLIKKIARWGLALFGIRSAYMGIRSAIGIISQSNKQLANDIQYIKWALAKTLEPIITRIVGWVYKLIQAINYLIYRITGVNLLSKMTAKNFKSASGSAKELRKTLAGFDEMNIVNSPSSGGGGGVSLPSEDLSKFNLLSDELMNTLNKMGDTLKPIWEKYLKPMGKWIMEKPSRLLEVLGGILGLKLASKIAKIIGAKGAASGAGASGLLGMLGVLGLLVADAWLIHIIVNSEDYKELKKNVKESGEELKSFREGQQKSSKAWRENTDEIWKNIQANGLNEKEVNKLADGLLKNIDNTEELTKSWKENKKTGNLVTDTIRMFNGEIGATNHIIEALNGDLEHDIKLLEEMWKQDVLGTEQKQKLAKAYEILLEKYKNEQKDLDKNSEAYKAYNKKIEDVQKNIDILTGKDYKVDVETVADKTKVDELSALINDITKTSHTIKLEASTKSANKTVKNWLSGLGSTLFTTLFPKLNFTTTLAKFHRMGGIINLPGKGVPITHYGGEGGHEGIIPMDEEQQMDILGRSIAKHVVINLTNVTKIDSRQFAKVYNKVKADSDFATNN